MKRSVSVSVDLVMVKWLILTVQEGCQETEIGVVFSMKRSGYIKAGTSGHSAGGEACLSVTGQVGIWRTKRRVCLS